MKLPNKLFSYSDSTISKFQILLDVLRINKEMKLFDLYEIAIAKFENLNEFIETLQCLFFISAIEYDYQNRKVKYAL